MLMSDCFETTRNIRVSLANQIGAGRNYSAAVGLGQNGQILFISVEQLSLNVAGDSAKTLSVLGNMGGVVDDCGLRFVQM